MYKRQPSGWYPLKSFDNEGQSSTFKTTEAYETLLANTSGEYSFIKMCIRDRAFGAYTERIPNLKKNELIKSRALKGNQDIKNTFSSQTGTVLSLIHI